MGSFSRSMPVRPVLRKQTQPALAQEQQPEQQQPQQQTSNGTAGHVQQMASATEESKQERMKKLFQIGLILLMILCFGILFSLVAPFFPAEAEKKGMSTTVVGILFGIYELIVFLFSPVWGILAPQIGFRFLTGSGTLLAGGATVLFGFLDGSPPGDVYIAMCFACRLVEAIGVSMYITASFAYASSLFPDKISCIFGLLETANGAGFMIGPPIGGLLYKWGGFPLPFLATGVLIIVLGSISTILLKPVQYKPQEASLSPSLVLKMPLILVLGICETVSASIFAFLDPTLSLFLEDIDITDPVIVGAIFMVCSVAYSLACLFTGKALDWWDYPYAFMIVGTIATCVGYLLIGPSPLIPLFRPNEASIIPSCVIGFVGLGFILLPLPKLLTDHLHEQGFAKDIKTNSLVSGIYNGLWHLGSFIGPSSAGAMVDGIGFLWSSTIMGLLAGALCVILTITSIVVRTQKGKRIEGEAKQTDNDNVPQTVQTDNAVITSAV